MYGTLQDNQKIDAPRAEYYRHCQCAIIMFDLTSSVTLKNVTQWLKNLNQICNSIPVVLVGNKADHQNKQITTNRLKNHKLKGLSFYDISVKTEYNFEKLFLWLSRELLGDLLLEFNEPGMNEQKKLEPQKTKRYGRKNHVFFS